jgi:hypothetical protein
MTDKTSLPTISKAQWLADLAWASQSPLMTSLNRYDPTQPQLDIDKSAAPDRQPGGLDVAPAQLTSRFLGPYFELLWRRLIELSSNLQLIAHNVQIHEAGKTLGEFDFFLKHNKPSCSHDTHTFSGPQPQSATIHQEVAVKFYLGLPVAQDNAPPSVWFGPNQLDRLDLKLNNMLTRQIKLSQQAGVRAKLAELLSVSITADSSIKPEIIIKGYLFHPYGCPLPLPEYANPQALSGQWLAFSKLSKLTKHYPWWAILPKLEWLAPTGRHHLQLLSASQLTAALTDSMAINKPQLIAAMAGNDVNHKSEIARFFIVSDHWQKTARQILAANPIKPIPSAVSGESG